MQQDTPSVATDTTVPLVTTVPADVTTATPAPVVPADTTSTITETPVVAAETVMDATVGPEAVKTEESVPASVAAETPVPPTV